MNTEHPKPEMDAADEPVAETGEESPVSEGADSKGSNAEPPDSGRNAPETAVPDPAPAAAPAKSRGGLAFLAFVFALVALAGTAWMWWQDSTGKGQEEERVFAEIARLESRDSELDSRYQQLRQGLESIPTSDASAEIAALEQRLERGVTQLEQIEQSVNEQLALSRSLQMAAEAHQRRLVAAESALSGMASRELDATHDLDLAEVDYLLRLANERLSLFHDPAAADETLKLADMHLAAMNDPIYLAVRQDIAAARQALAANEIPDYFAIGSEIDAIQQAIGSVPFKGEPQVSETVQQAESESWWGKLKSAFSNLVTVRHSTELESERISLEDRDYVRQRLWLQFEIAHLALMRRDQQAFQQALQRVRQTMEEWLDQDSAAYRNMDESIGALLERDIQVDVPDISKPWATLNQVRSLRSAPLSAPAAPPEPEQAPVETADTEAGGDAEE